MSIIPLQEVQSFEKRFRNDHALYSKTGYIYQGVEYNYQCQVLQDRSLLMTVVTSKGEVVARLSFEAAAQAFDAVLSLPTEQRETGRASN